MCGFKVTNHGESIVCAAVSMLCINTVNSLEAFTDCRLVCEYHKDGGYMECCVPELTAEAELLLKSLELGLESVKAMYGLDLVKEKYREVT